MLKRAKQFLLGRALRSSEEQHQRLSKVTGLAVFASDALSSTAYATEEILLVLIIAGAAALSLSVPLAILITAVIAIVILSYRQTIQKYPAGSGAYLVTKDNFGFLPAQIAGSMLLIDYALTVAVSVSAGIAAITSAIPQSKPYTLLLALMCVGLIAWANLRGLKESGKIFAGPTYLFIFSILLLIIWGLIKSFVFGIQKPPSSDLGIINNQVGLFLILRAFAAGCTALTGIEAISDGVGAFRKPEAKNARKTLTIMGIILGVVFLGVTVLSNQIGVSPNEHETIVSQIARSVFGDNILYYLIQGATMLILILAANTAFADFPRLAAFLAADKFLPRWLTNRGDRLVFSGGILSLAAFSAIFIVMTGAHVHNLIPLYAVGVFSSFTLSQFSMVKRWITKKEKGFVSGVLINGLGGLTTSAVLTIVILTKFSHGAWLVLLLATGLIFLFRSIHSHYDSVANQLTIRRHPVQEIPHIHTYIILVSEVHQGTMKAVQYVLDEEPDRVRAVHVNLNPERMEWVQRDWHDFGHNIPLEIIDCPYRDVVDALNNYIDQVERERDDDIITVVIPEFHVSKWWHHFLHNQTAKRIRKSLLPRDDVVVEVVTYHLH